MTPDQSRLRREAAARRRRRRRIAILAGLAALCLGAAVAIALRDGSSHHSSTGTRRASASHGGAATHSAALSPAGLALAKPALALRGIDDPAADPIQLTFKHPPRAGLLFNLETGQVLWQRNAFKRVRIASLTKMMTACSPSTRRGRATRCSSRRRP